MDNDTLLRKSSLNNISSSELVGSDCGVSRDGSNARNTLRAARAYGLKATGFRLELDSV